jgi:hypothetical protein
MNRRFLSNLLCVSALGGQLLHAQAPAAAANQDNANVQATTNEEALAQLRARIAEQQEQIKKMQQTLDQQQKMLEQTLANIAPATTATATAAAPKAAPTTADGTPVVATASSDANPVKLIPAVDTVKPDIAPMPRYPQHDEVKPTSPLSIPIGNTTFTPLGFIDATFFARSSTVGSGIGTNFGGVPFNNASADHLSESNFSAQNSRIGFRVDSDLMGAKILGYLEADFLFNNNATSFQVSSNSAGFRLRNYFVDATKGHFEVLGGQDWSFMTPNRVGLSPIPDNIFYTKNEDTNYQVGLVWTRQPQFRFIYHANDNFGIGLSVENPQQYIGGGSGASTAVLPTAISANVLSQFNNGGTTNSSTNTPNWIPDFIVKAAYDAHAGDKLFHIEAGGMLSGFKDYVTLTAAPAVHGPHTTVGGGGFVNLNLELVKNVHLVANTFFSDGGGRYIFGLAPDLIVRTNGSISLVHSDSTVDGIEMQVSKKTLLAFYYGGAYIGRDTTIDTTAAKPVLVGYGEPGTTQNRNVQEITFDWTQTLWKHPSYGSLALINQYSYVLRDPWAVVAPGPKDGHTNLFYVDLRYTLP